MVAYQKNNLFKYELQVDGKLYERLPSDVYIILHEKMFYALHTKHHHLYTSVESQLKEEYAK